MGEHEIITIRFTPDFGKLVKKNASKMPEVVKDILTRLGVMGTSFGKRLIPVDKGNLRKRFNYTFKGARELHIGTNVSYAPIILTNKPPFVIEAKNKKVLAWVTKGHIRPSTPEGWKEARKRGWARYAKRIRHPGGKNVMGKTNQYLRGEKSNVVSQVLRKHGIL